MITFLLIKLSGHDANSCRKNRFGFGCFNCEDYSYTFRLLHDSTNGLSCKLRTGRGKNDVWRVLDATSRDQIDWILIDVQLMPWSS